jgi:hypothetical protein
MLEWEDRSGERVEISAYLRSLSSGRLGCHNPIDFCLAGFWLTQDTVQVISITPRIDAGHVQWETILTEVSLALLAAGFRQVVLILALFEGEDVAVAENASCHDRLPLPPSSSFSSSSHTCRSPKSPLLLAPILLYTTTSHSPQLRCSVKPLLCRLGTVWTKPMIW